MNNKYLISLKSNLNIFQKLFMNNKRLSSVLLINIIGLIIFISYITNILYLIFSKQYSLISIFKIYNMVIIFAAMVLVNSNYLYKNSKMPVVIFNHEYYLHRSRLLNRSITYISIFFVVMISSIYFLSMFGFNTTNPDSARYLLSALIQSEAAVFIIIITLSLIVVQQNAYYSPRLVNIFKDYRTNPDFYILFFTYMISLIYGIWLLKQITVENVNSISIMNFEKTFIVSSLEDHLKIKIALSVFAFSSLFLYIRNTLELMNPSTIIKIMSSKITRKNVILALNSYSIENTNNFETEFADFLEEGDLSSTVKDLKYFKKGNDPLIDMIPPSIFLAGMIFKEKNPIQSVFDIVKGSLQIYDFETAREGLKQIRIRMKDLFKNEFENIDYNLILEDTFYNLYDVGILSIQKDAYTCAEQVILSLRYCGSLIIKNINQNTVDFAFIHFFEKMAASLIEQNNPMLIKRIQYSLYELAIIGISMNMEKIVIEIVHCLKKIGLSATIDGMNELGKNSEFIIREICNVSSEEGLAHSSEIGLNLLDYKASIDGLLSKYSFEK